MAKSGEAVTAIGDPITLTPCCDRGCSVRWVGFLICQLVVTLVTPDVTFVEFIQTAEVGRCGVLVDRPVRWESHTRPSCPRQRVWCEKHTPRKKKKRKEK